MLFSEWPSMRYKMLVSITFFSWQPYSSLKTIRSFQLLWKSFMPLVALLHSGPPTALGHVIYGTVLGRYPVYLPKAPVAPDPEIQNAAAPEIQAAAPETQDATAAASSDNSPES